MNKRLCLGLLVAILCARLTVAAESIAPDILREMASATGAVWMAQTERGAPLSFVAARENLQVEETTIHETIVRGGEMDGTLRQKRLWLPDAEMYLLETQIETALPEISQVNVVDWTFLFGGLRDGSHFKPLTYSEDTWYASTYWTGPDWTRVGRDWQHSGEKTSSVRLFTVPRDGKVVVSGRVCKADTNGGEIIGYRVLTYKGLNSTTPVSTTGEEVTPAAAGCPASQPTDTCEITRTVANYEGYLRELRKTLYEAYYRRTLDVAVAERLTQAAFDRFKLPKILSD